VRDAYGFSPPGSWRLLLFASDDSGMEGSISHGDRGNRLERDRLAGQLAFRIGTHRPVNLEPVCGDCHRVIMTDRTSRGTSNAGRRGRLAAMSCCARSARVRCRYVGCFRPGSTEAGLVRAIRRMSELQREIRLAPPPAEIVLSAGLSQEKHTVLSCNLCLTMAAWGSLPSDDEGCQKVGASPNRPHLHVFHPTAR
jgi:hypothetical protein